MITLKRNRRKFWYCKYLGETNLTKTINGVEYVTGEIGIAYSSAVAAYGNIAPATGESSAEVFGTDVSYDRVIQINGTSSGIDENTVFFVDKEPEYDANNQPLFDYKAVRVQPTLSHTNIAISKVRS